MPGDASFNKFNYWLRPSKQVERKILIEKLLRLSHAGYDVSSYKYLGFGSVYYADFIMFHKYLFIKDMDCVEHGEIPKRMKFNKPYQFITLKLRSYSQVAEKIRRTIPYLVWLDYDYPVTAEMLQDIDTTMQRLRRRSIFLVTIEGRPRLPNNHEDYEAVQEMAQLEREQYLVNYFQDMFGQFIDEGPVTANHLDETPILALFWEAVTKRIEETLLHRDDGLRFIQLFNFRYADGCQMMTIGGIVGTDEDEQQLEASGYFNEAYLSRTAARVGIEVPPLTNREKQCIDQKLKEGLTIDKLPFELAEESLAEYRQYYKQYPSYIEAIV